MVYLDNAATTRFTPKSAIKALNKEILKASNPGRSGHRDATQSALKVMRAREEIKEYFHAKSYECIFTKNCTEALNLVIFGSNLIGKHVITTIYEHNSVLRPLYKLYSDKIIKLTILSPDSNGDISPLRFKSVITKETSMIIVNHVSNVTGKCIDIGSIGKICSKNNITFVVDASQSAGHNTLDLESLKVDILCAPGHKGLLGVQGSGFALVNERILLKPLLYGGTGTASDNVYQPIDPPEALESGTLNTPSIVALAESIKYCKTNQDAISYKLRRLTQDILYGLKSIKGVKIYTSFNDKNSVVSFNLDNYHSTTVSDKLNALNIATRAGLHCAPLVHNYLKTIDTGTVRASVGYDTSNHDVNRFLNAIISITNKKL